ncbi:DegT/DnrJ/EryC1/StrS family aminotransferase [Akkermansiaceae bacterium]|nr:DegT/DnrJ/EryC1/StrS family aminotransferase [Akkermansiaceae bacterium]
MNDYPAIIGGERTRNTSLPPRKTMFGEEIKAVTDVMHSDNLSSFLGAPGNSFLGGEKVIEFEEFWKKKYGFKHAISVNSWTSGLMITVGAIGIEPGDEVICSPYSMSASATSVLFYGGIPIFADIDPDTYNLDPSSIESRITKNTKAILVVHIFGHTADMDKIMLIAEKYNLRVIEDAAQSPGISYKNKPVGAIGHIGGFSLNYHKHIHCGEGGMIVTNDDDLALKSQLIRNHGENCAEVLDKKYLPNIVGGNYRLTEIQAAIGIEQLKKLDMILHNRIKLANHLHTRLSNFDCLETHVPEEGFEHAYYVFPIKFNSKLSGLSRNLFVKSVNAEFMDATGWESTPLAEGYVKPLYLNPIYQEQLAIGTKGYPFSVNNKTNYNYSKGICPVVEKLYSEQMIITPLVRDPLTIDDLEDLITAISKVLKYSKEILHNVNQDQDATMYTPVKVASEKNVR